MLNDKTLVLLEKRNSRRVMPPSGTEALLNGEGIALGHVQVKDISLGGMLICGNNTIEGFSKYSFIDDICINIPLDETVFDANKYLFMGEGKIIRSFTDETSQTRCYAVEFTYDSLYLTQRLKAEIEEISPDANN